jgi:hypothetical protein
MSIIIYHIINQWRREAQTWAAPVRKSPGVGVATPARRSSRPMAM